MQITMKKALFFVLAVLLLFAVTGCDAAPDPNAGLYRGYCAEAFGATVPVSTVLSETVSVELQDGGRGTFAYGEDRGTLRWTLDGSAFSAELDSGESLTGTLHDGVLVLQNLLNTGATVTFVSEGRDSSAIQSVYAALDRALTTPSPTPQPTATPAVFDGAQWEGKWYGWFVISEGTGKYADSVNMAVDQVAELTVSGDMGRITFRAYGEDDSVTADVYVRFTEGVTSAGTMISVEGWSNRLPIYEDDWQIDPAESTVSQFARMIEIGGVQTDADGDSFRYHYFLRPWGMDWEDVAKAYPITTTLYENMMPVHYDAYAAEAGLKEK